MRSTGSCCTRLTMFRRASGHWRSSQVRLRKDSGCFEEFIVVVLPSVFQPLFDLRGSIVRGEWLCGVCDCVCSYRSGGNSLVEVGLYDGVEAVRCLVMKLEVLVGVVP